MVHGLNKVYMISLGRRVDRREHMIRQFSERGIPYELIEAVDGKESGHDYASDPHAFEKLYRKPPTPGEFGCYFSHLKAMETFLGTQDDYALIMEDDLKIKADWDKIKETTERQLTDAPMFDLFYPGKPIMPKTHLPINYCEGEGPKESIQLEKPPVGTQAYIVSARFAMFVVEHFRVFYRPIDQLFRQIAICGEYPQFNYYIAKPKDRWVEHDFGFGSEVSKP